MWAFIDADNWRIVDNCEYSFYTHASKYCCIYCCIYTHQSITGKIISTFLGYIIVVMQVKVTIDGWFEYPMEHVYVIKR